MRAAYGWTKPHQLHQLVGNPEVCQPGFQPSRNNAKCTRGISTGAAPHAQTKLLGARPTLRQEHMAAPACIPHQRCYAILERNWAAPCSRTLLNQRFTEYIEPSGLYPAPWQHHHIVAFSCNRLSLYPTHSSTCTPHLDNAEASFLERRKCST